MSGRSKFYSSLGLLIILNAVIKPIWIFGIDRQVQNETGISVYGEYFSLLNFSIVLSFLLDWGFTSYFNRQLASDRSTFVNQAGNFLLLKLIFSAVYTVLIFWVAMLTGIENVKMLTGLVLIQVCTSMFLFFRAIITAEQWFQTDAWLSVMDKTLMIVLCGSLLYYPSAFGQITIYNFIYAQLGCTALATISAMMILVRRGFSFGVFSSTFFNKKIFLAALPFAVTVLLMAMHYRLDAFLLQRIHSNGDHEAGIYAQAYRLLDASNMIGYLVAAFLVPFIARQWSEKHSIQSPILTARSLLLYFSMFVTLSAVWLAPWLQELLYHNRDSHSVEVLQLTLCALFGYTLVQVYGSVMTATGGIITFCYINLAAMILNIILNIIFIPTLGAKACAIAAICSQSFAGLATMVWVKYKLGVRYQFQLILGYIFIAAVLVLYFYLGTSNGVNNWLLLSGAGLLTACGLIVSNFKGFKAWFAELR